MSIRSFYWEATIIDPIRFFIKRKVLNRGWGSFRYGNAGDIFARNLLEYFYPGEQIIVCNREDSPKLITVGSVAQCSASGDILCGSGCKSPALPSVEGKQPWAHSLRGPLSLEACRKAGFDVSDVAYLADPGLLISKFVEPIKPVPNRVIFIPHYRERRAVLPDIPAGIKFVDIDARPSDVAREIMKAELVYTSSLHGIIFSHALGRPCVQVRPQTEEPSFKYQDYFLSMNLEMPVPADNIQQAWGAAKPVSPITLPITPDEITFPSIEHLTESGIRI
ncbi:polysaccharide pyruvyl transferase family protein [uncultured Martelella sp.]|uniref:polysaccharide pyruvyl transferase family protein n=1 Tax=uncultured Martelella sp. TaxID=392331 RepID=UPI0029C78A50|nr:polysaccharide pyruvyl transferase family protein [uncultured Martelella sp.]